MAKKLKSIPADKISLSNISELTDAVIKLADRQDKFEDSILKLTHKQERLQATFDNLVAVANMDRELNKPILEETKKIRAIHEEFENIRPTMRGEIDRLCGKLDSWETGSLQKRLETLEKEIKSIHANKPKDHWFARFSKI